ncbi:hypothetical protein B0T16DRAFT_160091 [Cercophora newfieldiana]|uniref:Uncharacterized protein n=1 Tax=Cercophora newfieldiana TaxID=92897 RepID=A0AA39Y5L9_9PEZI|nr:hypothetical protein B0T16DRAFT_160091 [Cercophora newfieldiana]
MSLGPQIYMGHGFVEPPMFKISSGILRVSMNIRKVGDQELRFLDPFLSSFVQRGYAHRLQKFNIRFNPEGLPTLDNAAHSCPLYLGCSSALGSFRDSIYQTPNKSPCFLLSRISGGGQGYHFTRFRQIVGCIPYEVWQSCELVTCSISLRYSPNLWEGDAKCMWLSCPVGWLGPEPQFSSGPMTKTSWSNDYVRDAAAMTTYQFQLHARAPFILITCGFCADGYVLKVVSLESQASQVEIHSTDPNVYLRYEKTYVDPFKGSGPVAMVRHQFSGYELIATLVARPLDQEAMFRNHKVFLALRHISASGSA